MMFVPRKESYDNLSSVLKCKNITLLIKVHILKVIVFPVVMFRCESWTIKKVEFRTTDVFELKCWRRLLRVPWRASISNQLILKEINSEYSLRGLLLNLQYFGPPDLKNHLVGKDSDAGTD